MDNKYNKPNILINNVVSFILNSNINNDKTREVIDKLLNNLTFTKKYIITVIINDIFIEKKISKENLLILKYIVEKSIESFEKKMKNEKIRNKSSFMILYTNIIHHLLYKIFLKKTLDKNKMWLLKYITTTFKMDKYIESAIYGHKFNGKNLTLNTIKNYDNSNDNNGNGNGNGNANGKKQEVLDPINKNYSYPPESTPLYNTIYKNPQLANQSIYNKLSNNVKHPYFLISKNNGIKFFNTKNEGNNYLKSISSYEQAEAQSNALNGVGNLFNKSKIIEPSIPHGITGNNKSTLNLNQKEKNSLQNQNNLNSYLREINIERNSKTGNNENAETQSI